MHVGKKVWISLLVPFAAMMAVASPATAQQQRPNIVFIMGDGCGPHR